jgi:hypothetical protein
MNAAIAFFASALVFAIAHIIWSMTWVRATESAWFLEPTASSPVYFVPLVLISLCTTVLRATADPWPRPVLAAFLGAFIADVVVMNSNGLTNLWPIQVLTDGVLIGVAVLVGGALGEGIRRRGVRNAA